MDLLTLGIIVPWILVSLVVFMTYALVTQATRQADSFISRLDELELGVDQLVAHLPKRADEEPTLGGLEPGTPAPAFALPALTSEPRTVSLEEYRGRRVLLMFFRPGCSFCQQLAPNLAALPTEGRDGHPIPLVLTTGDEQENRAFIAQHQLQATVLLQPNDALNAAYAVQGTPMGYLLDEQGTIASSLLAGADALLEAFRNSPTVSPNERHTVAHEGNGAGLKITHSRLQREGLAPGTPAPDFTLPDLAGTPRSLAEFRGQPVLLVFSDPNCVPCQALAPNLERLHRSTSDFRVLVVSRGELTANQAKVAEHGLTFPIVLQRHWEVSRAYAMFHTPIGYLVDAEGVLASNVAVGGDAILALARRPALGAGRQEKEVVTGGEA